MPRLFLGLELPDSIKAQLLPLQKLAPAGSKRVPPANMHITLVFIGKAELMPTHRALERLEHSPVAITLTEPGCFKQRNGAHFWIGLRNNTGLLDLRRKLFNALQKAELEPDDKPFSPHITLARYKGALSESARRPFLNQTLPTPALTFQVPHFSLYSSATLSEGPIYKIEERYPLPIE